jgi:Flp pilus assembly protein TadD
VPPGPEGDAVARALFGRAVEHLQANRLAAAEATFRIVLRIVPGHATSWRNVGLLRHHGGDGVGGIDALSRALVIDPETADAPDLRLRQMFSSAHARAQAAGDGVGAAMVARHWTRWLPDDPTALGAAAMAALTAGDLNRAEHLSRRLPQGAGGDPNLPHVRALIAMRRGNLSEASLSVRAALALAPQYADAWMTRASIALRRSDGNDAEAALSRALRLTPNHPGALLALAGHRVAEGRADEAATLALRVAPAVRRTPAHIGDLLSILHHAPGMSPETIRAEREGWATPAASAPPTLAPAPAPPLRVVYLGDFGRPQVPALALPAIAAHARPDARERIACHLVHACPPDHPPSPAPDVPGLPTRDLGTATAEALRIAVRDLNPHILVLLTPTTLPQALEALAQRLAPAQVIWGDVFGSVGLPSLDGLLTDAHHVTGEPGLLSERPILLPHGAYFFSPPADAPDPGPPPCLASGAVTFGSFNRMDKINDPLLDRWGRILAALPEARLLIQARVLDRTDARRAFLDRLARHGIASDRVRLEGGRDRTGMAALYREADIALDADPWSGGLTVLELLWMGLPVIALAGRHPCGRHATSHLRRVDLADWVTETPEAYVSRAIAAARDPGTIATLRAELRGRLAALPLCDPTAYARQLEDAYNALWDEVTAVSGPTGSGTFPESPSPPATG